MTDNQSPIVSCLWLQEHLADRDLRLIDMRWGDKQHAYASGHIPGAQFLSASEHLTDKNNPVPDMLPGPEAFAAVIRGLGVSSDSTVVVYDDFGIPMLAARLWWAMSYYGHARVMVLDGGLRQWNAEGRPLAADVGAPPPGNFLARPNRALFATKRDVLAATQADDCVIVDCLNADLYAGLGEKHKWGPRKGHVPGAVNVPFVANADPSLALANQDAENGFFADRSRSGRLASPAALATLYRSAGVAPTDRVITYCGRGYAAAVAVLALKAAGHNDVSLYDGSWSEWSSDHELPVELKNSDA